MKFILHILVIVAVFAPSAVLAKRPRGAVLTGEIQRIDHVRRTVVMVQSNGLEHHFIYSRSAKFWRGNYPDSPAALEVGMRVQINLRNPLFGPDVTSQFVLISQVKTIPRQ